MRVMFRLPSIALTLVLTGMLSQAQAIDFWHKEVSVIKVIIENDNGTPGQASIFFPHLNQWLDTDIQGSIPLPTPFVGDGRLIKVRPKDAKHYGPEFQRAFPKGDGLVSLRATEVTQSIQAKSQDFIDVGEFAKAATASAVAASRTSNQAESTTLRRTAFELLVKQFGGSFVQDGGDFRATSELVDAINAKLAKPVLPSNGKFSSTDFRNAAGLNDLSSIVSDAQRHHFESLRVKAN